MKNWILIIDSLNGILSDSIANKEIAYICNDAPKITQGDRLLGYISTPIGEIRMILAATKDGNGTTLFLEKMFEVSSGCKVTEDLYTQILSMSSTENKCLEISEDSYNVMVRAVFESINTQKQLLLNDSFLANDDWYSTPATEYEYNTFKKLLAELFDLSEVNISDEKISDFGEIDYILYQLQAELNIQFNTRKQSLLKTLYVYIVQEKTLESNYGLSLFGTSSFHVVWEKVCAQVLDNQYERLKSEIDAPQWYGYDEADCEYFKAGNKVDTLIPDIIVLNCNSERKHFAILVKDKMDTHDLLVASNHFARLNIEIIWANDFPDISKILHRLY